MPALADEGLSKAADFVCRENPAEARVGPRLLEGGLDVLELLLVEGVWARDREAPSPPVDARPVQSTSDAGEGAQVTKSAAMLLQKSKRPAAAAEALLFGRTVNGLKDDLLWLGEGGNALPVWRDGEEGFSRVGTGATRSTPCRACVAATGQRAQPSEEMRHRRS